MDYKDLPVGTKLTAILNVYYELPVSEDEVDEGLLFEAGNQGEIVAAYDTSGGKWYEIIVGGVTQFFSAEDVNYHFTWDGDGAI
jgi:hypothetical protein